MSDQHTKFQPTWKQNRDAIFWVEIYQTQKGKEKLAIEGPFLDDDGSYEGLHTKIMALTTEYPDFDPDECRFEDILKACYDGSRREPLLDRNNVVLAQLISYKEDNPGVANAIRAAGGVRLYTVHKQDIADLAPVEKFKLSSRPEDEYEFDDELLKKVTPFVVQGGRYHALGPVRIESFLEESIAYKVATEMARILKDDTHEVYDCAGETPSSSSRNSVQEESQDNVADPGDDPAEQKDSRTSKNGSDMRLEQLTRFWVCTTIEDTDVVSSIVIVNEILYRPGV
ncbi:hypothetical protein EK21DRAFT_92591 [Setomelanomma holmii]|uniref:Uncharacterized protein n=1 Tax=Setomelanomma holmii TaxID=210430 RepID=A0A9P4LGX6_9PLEO|nr:hypothetical protein EK21DRAFT_92591 [Setomelanomma holmii]